MKFINFLFFKIAKNRYSGDLGIMPLEFDKQSLSYAHKIKKKSESTDLSQTQQKEQSEMFPEL